MTVRNPSETSALSRFRDAVSSDRRRSNDSGRTMSSWSLWCRLCAKEPTAVALDDDADLCRKIEKHRLAMLHQKQLPSSICGECHKAVNTMDEFVTQCERAQRLFESLLANVSNQNPDTSCHSFRDDYLNYYEKDESDEPNAGPSPERYTNDDQEFDDSVHSYSDDDHVPLSSISGLKLNRKRKTKKLKLSIKAKRKKCTKTKDKLEKLNNSMDVKDEPFSDGEKLGKTASNDRLKDDEQNTSNSIISFVCYMCRKNCKNWNALCRHFSEVHNARAEVQCCCGKYLASRVSISRHLATHGKTTSFDCNQCSKRFPRESELQSHMIAHLPKEEHPYVCCKCAKRFHTQQLLKHHEKKHIPVEQRTVFECKLCITTFASKSSLAMHIKSVHEQLKPFVCDQCGRAFTTKGILEEHLVRHSDARPYVCNECNKSFKTKQRLAIHCDTHKDTLYQCPSCPMLLNSRRTLRMHLVVHDDIMRYQCKNCDKAFKRAKDLKNHTNVHSGERPYACTWCSRTFANGSNCRAHKRRMHPNELRAYEEFHEAKHIIIGPNGETTAISAINAPSGVPKVIHTTVKRVGAKSANMKIPNLVMCDAANAKNPGELLQPPEKDSIEDMKPEIVTPTKQEASSPVHTYESSLSPLNLNASSDSIKQTQAAHLHHRPDIASLIITPLIQHYEHMSSSSPDYHHVEASPGFGHVPLAIVHGKKEDFTDGYKVMNHHHHHHHAAVGKGTQQHVYYGSNNIQSEYPNNSTNFNDAQQYEL